MLDCAMHDFEVELDRWVQPQVIRDLTARYSMAELSRKTMAVTLLSASSKTEKDPSTLNAILYLSPANHTSRVTLCPWSNATCRAACIIHSGRMRYKNAQQARILRTIKFLVYPNLFAMQLTREIARHEERAEALGKVPVVRLNGTSDLQAAPIFRNLPQAAMLDEVRAHFPNVRFPEYTKNPTPSFRAANHFITFSYSGTNLKQARAWLSQGRNVAVVFRDECPDTWQGYPVINGDVHDNRFKDASGVVVGLILKGNQVAKQAAVAGNFAVPQPASRPATA